MRQSDSNLTRDKSKSQTGFKSLDTASIDKRLHIRGLSQFTQKDPNLRRTEAGRFKRAESRIQKSRIQSMNNKMSDNKNWQQKAGKEKENHREQAQEKQE